MKNKKLLSILWISILFIGNSYSMEIDTNSYQDSNKKVAQVFRNAYHVRFKSEYCIEPDMTHESILSEYKKSSVATNSVIALNSIQWHKWKNCYLSIALKFLLRVNVDYDFVVLILKDQDINIELYKSKPEFRSAENFMSYIVPALRGHALSSSDKESILNEIKKLPLSHAFYVAAYYALYRDNEFKVLLEAFELEKKKEAPKTINDSDFYAFMEKNYYCKYDSK